MKKLYLFLLTLLCTVGAWAAVLPTEGLKTSSNLPTGTPEYQFYIRQTKNNGQYWTAETKATTDKNAAGKFAFYAVPGVENCYYIYNVDQKKWVNYSAARSEGKNFVSLADNFNANAYWEFTQSTCKGTDGAACYQLRPTTDNKNPAIKTGLYANWHGGASAANTLGLYTKGPTDDEGSAWSLELVASNTSILMAQEIAFAKYILEANNYAYTKGENILTTDNVTSILSSPYTSSKEGSLANLVDGNAGTHWHSVYPADDAAMSGSHYIVATLSGSVPERMSFTYKRRTNASADQTSRWAVYGVPSEGTFADDSRDGLTLLAVISTPTNTSVFENLPIFETKGFKKFRFCSEATNNNRVYFHIGEFQLNGWTEATTNTDEMKALAEAIKIAEAVESPEQSDVDALKAVTGAYKASDEEKAAAQALLDKTSVGYPSATAAARVALAEALAFSAGASSDELQTLVANYKACTDVALPENGKAYTFTFVDKNGNEYKMGANGTTLSGNATDAAVFYCKKYTNVDGQERYAFISAEGNFLAYHTLTGEYRTHVNADKRLQNDFIVAPMINVTSNVDANTNEVRFGTVYLKVDNRTLAKADNTGAMILTISGASFTNGGVADVPFFTGAYTSALKVTEVADYSVSHAVQLAASTITPLVEGYKTKDKIGTDLGYYTEAFKGTSYPTFNEFETAINAATEVIAVSDYSIAPNLPEAGKFYRIAYDYGGETGVNYLQGNNVTVSGKGEAASYSSEDGASSIFYYSNDGKLLSYTAGRYLAVNGSSRGLVGVGVAGANATFAASPRTLGKLTLNMGSYVHANTIESTGESVLFVDRCSGDVCANHDHIVTEVTMLPVTISEAGYSTLYSPVALTLPDNENVKAYYVTTTTSAKATLDEITDRVIPANAGVILSGPEETYDLTVGGEATANENNKLTGTVASAYIADAAYVLANGTNGVGLYLAAKNQENNTKWLNNGFKAYMLTSQVPSGAPALTFDFGTETGIEGVGAAEAGKSAIYDLSGRRVKSAQKGIFIINGKKVVK